MRLPSTDGEESRPRPSQSFTLPEASLGTTNCQRNAPVFSPTVEGNRVYLVTSRCEVICLDTDGLANGDDGRFTAEAQYIVGPCHPKAKIGPTLAHVTWAKDMIDQLGVFPHSATNSSELVVDDLGFACTSNG